jgi:hypothetical protein
MIQAQPLWTGKDPVVTLEAGVGRYMQRCVSLNITLKLERCLATAAKLMREGKAPVLHWQCRPFIDSLQQQQQQQQPRRPGVYYAAAVQYGAAYMPYTNMGPPAAGMPYFPALMQPAPLPLPAPGASQADAAGGIAAAANQGEYQPMSSGNPFGNSFAMLAILPTLQEEEADPVAAVITRSNKTAADNAAAAPRQSMPKSFLPPGPLPMDPNSSQARHTSAVDIDLDAAAPIEYKMTSTEPKALTKTARLLQGGAKEL